MAYRPQPLGRAAANPMSEIATEINSLPIPTENDLFRVGTYGKTRDSCGLRRNFAHPAADTDFHYRRGSVVCRRAACSVPACRAYWLRSEREAVLARADKLFDAELATIAAARKQIADDFRTV